MAAAYAGIVFALFLAVKMGGTALAEWSWWWVLMPIVPDVYFILTAMGVAV